MSLAVNEQRHCLWLAEGQQPLCKKGNGCSIHVSDFILETTGRLALNEQQLQAQACLPQANHLKVTDAWKIIYPGKNGDAWWDMPQLLMQMEAAVSIFEYLHPSAVGVWMFDCSSAHEAMAPNALIAKWMNLKPGGKQPKMQDTRIPLNNPLPKLGDPDTRGMLQSMVFPNDHTDPALQGQPKGLWKVLQECKSVWDHLCAAVGGEKKVKTTCAVCKQSQQEKDWLACVAATEHAEGDQGTLAPVALVRESPSNVCCMVCTMSQQEDFRNEKPLIQTYLEDHGHITIFLPKFHCELAAIEMYWRWTKHSKSLFIFEFGFFIHNASEYHACLDSKFTSAKVLVPKILDSVEIKLIRRFFHKAWHYMDAYE